MTTNYREILRLKNLGLNKTDIARSVLCARNTVSTVLERAEACGLQWPLPDGMSDHELAERLFPGAPGKASFKMPDYERVALAKLGSLRLTSVMSRILLRAASPIVYFRFLSICFVISLNSSRE